MKKIFLLLLILFSTINVKAYENNYFSIDIPDDYKEIKLNNNAFKWTNGNKYIAITISDNREKKYNIKNYTEEDIENQKKYIENNINDELKDYDFKVKVTNIEKKQINDLYSLNYSIYWPTLKTTGYDIHQIGNVYTTNKYIITVIYSSDIEINDENEYYNIINSFKIKDQKLKVITSREYIVGILTLGIILAIIFTIKRHKTKKA